MSLRRVVLATRNAKKIPEIHHILTDAGVDIELVGLGEFPNAEDVVETGLTFEDNALLKAHAAVAATGLPALADDSGISVVALNGMPGVFSGRWSGRHGDDAANLDLLLGQLSDVPDEHRAAAFVCAAAFVTTDGNEIVEEGRVSGRLIRERRGSGGFGYDPIFVPDGDTRTTAEMPAEEKHTISHRGRAFRAIAARLATLTD